MDPDGPEATAILQLVAFREQTDVATVRRMFGSGYAYRLDIYQPEREGWTI